MSSKATSNCKASSASPTGIADWGADLLGRRSRNPSDIQGEGEDRVIRGTIPAHNSGSPSVSL